MSSGIVRVGQYGRASHLNERSVDDQLIENDAWVAREPTWRTVWVKRDDGRSASKFATKARPGWEQAMTSIEAGEIDLLLCWELSRASRDRRVFAALFAACEENDVKIGVGGRVYDLADEEDAFQLDLQAALAVRESGKTQRRVKRGSRSSLASGRPTGKPPFGYRPIRSPETGKLDNWVADEETAPIVREIAKRALAGEPLATIATDLNERGIRTRPTKKFPEGARWDGIRVRRVAINPTYAAYRVHNNEIATGVEASWPAILDDDDDPGEARKKSRDLHDQLVAKLCDPRRKSYADGSTKHLLVNIARCGKTLENGEMCGARCRRIKNRGTPSYACERKFCVARTQGLVDTFVTEVVIGRLEREDALELLVPDESGQANAARQEAAVLRARLEKFYSRGARGEISDEGVARIEKELIPLIRAAERRAEQHAAAASPLLAQIAGPGARERWERLTVPQRREVIRVLGVPVILPTGRGRWRDPAALDFLWHHEAK
ncbi:hypothetical protein DMH03_17615 [Amycolatopsis sp. WAC 01376]|uniref:recombinase family protein n=1 Tax=Amycolatopsis sp. WAC 01376 TaxID=2203195 RepID=UPI000F7AA50F|nr:recombinase family protein [Amycolatopsis sp. WAC 01376]RSM60566.1 hypothetical protein DMH03_17615 [Amycolatopsis sp. WAC 01376]